MCHKYKYPCLCLLLWAAGVLNAQEWQNPFDFPVLLSGNFGELRNDHFHAGIDFKTQSVEGKPVHAVQEGYIARVVVSPWGYGNALYLNHPDGTTTVYGHLQKFTDRVTAYVKEQQYARETFAIDLTLAPEQFPLRKGQIIALAGNTGSSAGPHLHFEVRNTETGLLCDPMEYYKDQIKDSLPPKIEGFMVYPMEGKGIVNANSRKMELKLLTAKNGKQTQAAKVEAWGDIALAVKAYDYMDRTSNIYGVRRMVMAIDTQVVFSSNIDCFSPNETRYINSFIDYEAWREKRAFYMKTFVEPGNKLSFIKSVNRGIISIDEERTYRISFRLRDFFGNMTQHTLWIEGKQQAILSPNTEGEYFHWKGDNRFGAKGVRLLIPGGSLYDDIYFRYAVQPKAAAWADVHVLHDPDVPLHTAAQLSLHLQADTLADKQKYGIVRMQNKRAVWIGGTYRNGWIDADIRQFGNYTIMHDTRPPLITAIEPATWVSRQRITFRITDALSGVKDYRGEIDGQFVLFEFDGKKNLVTYRFDKTRLERGKHELTFTLTDYCGNRSEYKRSFVW
ncbi:MAG: M23 family metallopeptidase [Tannerellaceae bacterium]|jgi:murein DD-endopeptidase MepM/ murein hydrolase activator NlpD|nr:M23 family metallopeptidase [Tannerellaceae bacterium]